MAASEVVISGLLYHGKSGAGTPVTIVGIAGYSNLTVGGGPIFPESPPAGPPGTPSFPISGPPGIDFPDKPGYPPTVGGGPIIPPQQPPGGGQPGVPTFPIWGPPGIDLPPGSGYPPVAGHPLPPDQPRPEPIIGWEAKTFWTPETGWGVAIVPKEGTPVPTPSR